MSDSDRLSMADVNLIRAALAAYILEQSKPEGFSKHRMINIDRARALYERLGKTPVGPFPRADMLL
jgi:hypothetical protein